MYVLHTVQQQKEQFSFLAFYRTIAPLELLEDTDKVSERLLSLESTTVGAMVGVPLRTEGALDGAIDGVIVGAIDGDSEGAIVGAAVGALVGVLGPVFLPTLPFLLFLGGLVDLTDLADLLAFSDLAPFPALRTRLTSDGC